jgi:hypothetical protein
MYSIPQPYLRTSYTEGRDGKLRAIWPQMPKEVSIILTKHLDNSLLSLFPDSLYMIVIWSDLARW